MDDDHTAPRRAAAVVIQNSEATLVRPEDLIHDLTGLEDFMNYWVDQLMDRIRDLL